MKAISLTNLTKNYGKNRGIEQVNLSIEEGEFFGFIGPKGAGKSTTIRLLLGLIKATSGHAEMFGQDVWSKHVHVYNQQVLRFAAHLHGDYLK